MKYKNISINNISLLILLCSQSIMAANINYYPLYQNERVFTLENHRYHYEFPSYLLAPSIRFLTPIKNLLQGKNIRDADKITSQEIMLIRPNTLLVKIYNGFVLVNISNPNHLSIVKRYYPEWSYPTLFKHKNSLVVSKDKKKVLMVWQRSSYKNNKLVSIVNISNITHPFMEFASREHGTPDITIEGDDKVLYHVQNRKKLYNLKNVSVTEVIDESLFNAIKTALNPILYQNESIEKKDIIPIDNSTAIVKRDDGFATVNTSDINNITIIHANYYSLFSGKLYDTPNNFIVSSNKTKVFLVKHSISPRYNIVEIIDITDVRNHIFSVDAWRMYGTPTITLLPYSRVRYHEATGNKNSIFNLNLAIRE